MTRRELIFFMDYMSQPSRAVLSLLKISKIPHSVRELRILKGEHQNSEFINKYPLGRIPAIDDNGLLLAESHAIMRYICNQYPLDDHWYPRSPEKRAYVDQYLDWHHQNTRRCASYLFTFFPTPMSKYLKVDRETEKKTMEVALKTIDSIFLKDGQKFLAGNEISIADLSAVCEIMQLRLLNYDLKQFRNLEKWIERCMEVSELRSAHETFFKVLNKVQAPKL